MAGWGIPSLFSNAIINPKYYVDQAVFWSQIANDDYIADQMIEEECHCGEVHEPDSYDEHYCNAVDRLAKEIREMEDHMFLSAIEEVSSKMTGRVWEIGGPKRAIFLKEGSITCLLRD